MYSFRAGARYRTDMVHNGSSTAMYHAARGLTPEGQFERACFRLAATFTERGVERPL